jgi:hypothetical protein
MQKVESSSLFIRFTRKARTRGPFAFNQADARGLVNGRGVAQVHRDEPYRCWSLVLKVALIVVAIAVALAALAVVLHDDPPPDASHAGLPALTTAQLRIA